MNTVTKNNVKIRGYCAWSCLDNFEWYAFRHFLCNNTPSRSFETTPFLVVNITDQRKCPITFSILGMAVPLQHINKAILLLVIYVVMWSSPNMSLTEYSQHRQYECRADGYAKRFGIIYTDYTTLERHIKDSARWLSKHFATSELEP